MDSLIDILVAVAVIAAILIVAALWATHDQRKKERANSFINSQTKLFHPQPDDIEMWQAARASHIDPACDCLTPQYGEGVFGELRLHSEVQDTECEAWKQLQSLIDAAIASGSKEFSPGLEMSTESWSRIVTLPASIAKLTSVKRLYLYNSHLVRIPPEIGEMTNLEELDLYTSYRLHWLPYEVTRCRKLKRSRVSTRALYGNFKYRPPFPHLPAHLPPPATCSICQQSFSGSCFSVGFPCGSALTFCHCWLMRARRNVSGPCLRRPEVTLINRTSAGCSSSNPPSPGIPLIACPSSSNHPASSSSACQNFEL